MKKIQTGNEILNNAVDPLENDATLERLIDIYCNWKVDSGTRPIEDSTGLYRGIIYYGQDKENINEYDKEFNQNILLPNMNKLYKNIKDAYSTGIDKKVESMIKQIEAEENRKNGTVPKYEKTIAEKDKELAEEYMESVNEDKRKKVIELAKSLMGKDGIKKARLTIEEGAEKLSKKHRQTIAVARMVTRQQGKIPGETYIKDGKCYFEIGNTKAKIRNDEEEKTNSEDGRERD